MDDIVFVIQLFAWAAAALLILIAVVMCVGLMMARTVSEGIERAAVLVMAATAAMACIIIGSGGPK